MMLHWLAVLHLLAAVALTQSAASPNIVIFLADDLGIGDIGCFGNDTIRTPNIDRIAQEGAKLTHHIAAASICSPSRAALMTGRYPIRMGMVHPFFRAPLNLCSGGCGMPENEYTVAELVKQKGYTSAIIGKWHLGLNCERYGDSCRHPMNQGFDYFYGLPLSNASILTGQSFLLSMFPHLKALLVAISIGGTLFLWMLYRRGIIRLWFLILASVVILGICGLLAGVVVFGKVLMGVVWRNYAVVEQPINLENFTKRLVYEGDKFLEARQKDKAPFLLYMPWLQVHTGLHAGPDFRGRSKHGAYGDEVEEMDWSVGAILSTLEKLGMKENTLVYFSSDNGGWLEERGGDGSVAGGWNGIYRGGKGQGGMDGGIRMPTVAMWPGKIPPVTVVDLPTSQMDVFATVAALLDLPLPTDRIIDGVDIMPLLTKKDQKLPPPHEFLFHYCGDNLHAARYTPKGNKGDVWKAFFVTPNWIPGTQTCPFPVCSCQGGRVTIHDPPLLFNIGKDPSEMHELDVSRSPHKEILEKIIHAVEEHKASVEPVPSQLSLYRQLPRPWLQPCCGGGHFPHCMCSDEEHAHFLK